MRYYWNKWCIISMCYSRSVAANVSCMYLCSTSTPSTQLQKKLGLSFFLQTFWKTWPQRPTLYQTAVLADPVSTNNVRECKKSAVKSSGQPKVNAWLFWQNGDRIPNRMRLIVKAYSNKFSMNWCICWFARVCVGINDQPFDSWAEPQSKNRNII